MNNDLDFYEKDALLYRLHEGLKNSQKDVVFVVGAPITAPIGGSLGVADVAAVVDLVRNRFAKQARQLEKLDECLSTSSNQYQAAFDFLVPRQGQDATNQIIKEAVSKALLSPNENICQLQDSDLKQLDLDTKAWHLTPAVEAIGELIAKFPDRFGNVAITSNFDPLIEVAIKRAGGAAWRTSLQADGSINQSSANGCQVIHIHGYWHGTDTLHTNRQLVRKRPTLQNDLLTRLQNSIVVVMAYGGWQDIFTGALGGVVGNDNLFPEILWACYDKSPEISDYLLGQLQPGIDRNRVTFYRDIDCNEFLPQLVEAWESNEAVSSSIEITSFPTDNSDEPPLKTKSRASLFRLAPLECDRPPNVKVWVGRENELRALEASNANVVIVCGIGGEGKSALASHYIANLGEREGGYRFWDWRDCKEQGDRIRTQIIEIIVRFANGTIDADDVADASDAELVDILIDHTKEANSVLVFDNVDSYVDLECGTFIDTINLLVEKFSSENTTSRIILTCRPDVQYSAASVITFSLKGLSENEAIELFRARSPDASIPEADIRDAHKVTKGHAFWLDLLAVQAAQVPGTTLRKMLDDMRRGREEGPDVLSSIWDKLALREQKLLRFMAEAVRPETEETIQKFVASQVNYKNFKRALRSLIALNLIVVKPEDDAPDLYDLHPLVRQFVRTRFEQSERTDIIAVVIKQYKAIIGTFGVTLGANMPFALLERWSQKAELEISAGLYEDAFESLVEVEGALIGGGHLQEYVRVGRLLFESINWESAATKYQQFDRIVGVMAGALDQLDDRDSTDSLLVRYAATIPQKTARYIKLCDVQANSHWLRGEFDEAIDWATKGVALKKDSNVDTDFDCSHTLALAQRDAGSPDLAIEFFRKDWAVLDIVNGVDGIPDDGPMYGNVGRCLQMTGRNEEALKCYKRSYQLLENDASSQSKSNRAYARQWIGETFLSLDDATMAEAFFVDAIRILGSSAPVRVKKVLGKAASVNASGQFQMSEAKAGRIVRKWSLG